MQSCVSRGRDVNSGVGCVASGCEYQRDEKDKDKVAEQDGPTASRRVMVYVDGFNLYYGLKSKGWRRFYWLNPVSLSERLLRTDQHLVGVRYFTARISGRQKEKRRRQARFLEAIATLPALTIHYGHFLQKTRTCAICGSKWVVYEEKMSDVNLAVSLLGDAQDDRFDTALVVSADGDLAGPVVEVLERYPNKRVVVVFPPNRRSEKLRSIASAAFTVGRKYLKDSQLPEKIIRSDGSLLARPDHWR